MGRPPATPAIDEERQSGFLNLETKDLDPYWVDPKQPLRIPVNPAHYTAHKYQVMLERLEAQAKRNPAQFNSGNYIAIMEKLEKLWEQINGAVPKANDRSTMGAISGSATPAVGETKSAGLDSTVQAENPLPW